jgi:aryl-phospho-beta-D-glucosidase BglC (GH1 family)
MFQFNSLGVLSATIGLSFAAVVYAQDSYSGKDEGLTVSGNQIVDQNGNNVRLTGVNWSGFETPIAIVSGLYQSPSATASPDFRDYLLKVKDLGFNCIRLPWSYANMICTLPAAGDEKCNVNGVCTDPSCGGTYNYSNPNASPYCPECSDVSFIAGSYYNASNSASQNASSVNQLTTSPFYGTQLNAPLFDTTLDRVNYALQAKSPLKCMDEVIKYAGSIGLKVILDNHCIVSGKFASQPLWYTDSVSQQQWIDQWVAIADHYADETNDPYHAVVACDLFNEPKMDPRTAGGSAWTTATGPQAWNHAAEACGKAILAANSRLLIMVEGTQWANADAVFPTGSGTANGNTFTNWGANLTGAAAAPIDLGAAYQNKLVYSIHDYPGTAQTLSGQNVLPWFSASNYPNNLDDQAWRPFWGYLVEENTAPMFVGEFGSWLRNPTVADAEGNVCGYTALTSDQVTSDKLWVNALLHYMQGDWNLAQPINTTPDSQAIAVTVGGDAAKKGISFCWFGFTPNSADTGGVLDCDYTSTETNKMAYLGPYLAPLLPEYETALLSDMNGDGFVGGFDLSLFLALWGVDTGGSRFTRGDFNHDGVRNGADLAILLNRWRSN